MDHGAPLPKVQHPDAPLTQYFVSSGKVKSTSQTNANFLQLASLNCSSNCVNVIILTTKEITCIEPDKHSNILGSCKKV